MFIKAISARTLVTCLISSLVLFTQNVFAETAKTNNQSVSTDSLNKQTIVLQNDVLHLEIGTTGGAPVKAILREYLNYNNQLLTLFQNNDNKFNLVLPTCAGGTINTESLSFNPIAKTDSSLTLSAKIESGSIDFCYTLHKGSYIVDYTITTNNLNNIVKPNANTQLVWECSIPTKGKNADYDCDYSEIVYKEYRSSSAENISSFIDIVSFSQDLKKKEKDPIHWVAFKDLFFSTVLIAEDGQPMSSGEFESYRLAKQSKDAYVELFKANLKLGFDASQNQTSKYLYYFGPNQLNLLSGLDTNKQGDSALHLDNLVSRWFIIRWINKNIFTPFYNFVSNAASNMFYTLGSFALILILLHTIMSFHSKIDTCKKSVIAPIVNEHVKGIEEELERRHVAYITCKKIGYKSRVYPGCIAAILLIFFYLNIYSYFISNIELFGKQFLWIDDLSTYDTIYDLGFEITLYGSHVSLLALLLALIPAIRYIYNLVVSHHYAKMQSNKVGTNKKISGFIFTTFPILFFCNWFNSAYLCVLLLTQLTNIIINFITDIYIDRYKEKYELQIHKKLLEKTFSNPKSVMEKVGAIMKKQRKNQPK